MICHGPLAARSLKSRLREVSHMLKDHPRAGKPGHRRFACCQDEQGIRYRRTGRWAISFGVVVADEGNSIDVDRNAGRGVECRRENIMDQIIRVAH